MLPSLRPFLPRQGPLSARRRGFSSKPIPRSHAVGTVTLNIENGARKSAITLSAKYSQTEALDQLFGLLKSRKLVHRGGVVGLGGVRMYCTSKEERKKEKEEEETKEEEHVDVEAKSSPFAKRSSGEQSKASDGESFKFVPPPDSEQTKSRVPPGKSFTPSYIITINTEKGMFRKLWRGMGLISFNFVIAAKSWSATPEGGPIPTFWAQQIHTARLDALLLLWAICSITGADVMAFLVWMVGAIMFPAQLVPSVLRTPSRAEVRKFVYDHLRDLDTEGTGRASLTDARRVLWVVEKEMTPEVVQAVLQSADGDDTSVDYTKLADIVVGNNAGSNTNREEE